MANDKPNTPETITITAREIDALADRCLARAVSQFFEAQPNLRNDLLLCVGCLRELARDNTEYEIRVWREFTP
jgi:hypothetical protein